MNDHQEMLDKHFSDQLTDISNQDVNTSFNHQDQQNSASRIEQERLTNLNHQSSTNQTKIHEKSGDFRSDFKQNSQSDMRIDPIIVFSEQDDSMNSIIKQDSQLNKNSQFLSGRKTRQSDSFSSGTMFCTPNSEIHCQTASTKRTLLISYCFYQQIAQQIEFTESKNDVCFENDLLDEESSTNLITQTQEQDNFRQNSRFRDNSNLNSFTNCQDLFDCFDDLEEQKQFDEESRGLLTSKRKRFKMQNEFINKNIPRLDSCDSFEGVLQRREESELRFTNHCKETSFVRQNTERSFFQILKDLALNSLKHMKRVVSKTSSTTSDESQINIIFNQKYNQFYSSEKIKHQKIGNQIQSQPSLEEIDSSSQNLGQGIHKNGTKYIQIMKKLLCRQSSQISLNTQQVKSKSRQDFLGARSISLKQEQKLKASLKSTKKQSVSVSTYLDCQHEKCKLDPESVESIMIRVQSEINQLREENDQQKVILEEVQTETRSIKRELTNQSRCLNDLLSRVLSNDHYSSVRQSGSQFDQAQLQPNHHQSSRNFQIMNAIQSNNQSFDGRVQLQNLSQANENSLRMNLFDQDLAIPAHQLVEGPGLVNPPIQARRRNSIELQQMVSI